MVIGFKIKHNEGKRASKYFLCNKWRLERNKLSARKFRLNRKMRIKSMEKQLEEMKKENEQYIEVNYYIKIDI